MAGTVGDIGRNAKVIVHMRVANGVYFVSNSYGTSLEAATVFVIKEQVGGGSSDLKSFDLGGFQMVDHDGDDGM